MKTLRLTVLGALALALTACPPPEEEETTTEEPEVEVAEEETVSLSAVGDSGVSGEASLMALNGQTDVRVEVESDQERADAQVTAAIYHQQCDDLTGNGEGEDRDEEMTGTDGGDQEAQEQEQEQPTPTGQVEQLEAITLDQDGRGAGSTSVQQRMENLADGSHSILLMIDNEAVACGDIAGGMTTGF